jgi:ribosomal protein L35AE/L33A
MDLSLFLIVLWRAKRLVIVGVLVGAVLAVLAYGQPSFAGGRPTLAPRSAEVWQSEAQLLIGQSAYPYRQSGPAEPDGSLGSLSPIYANLANGSIMQGEIRRHLGTRGTVKATEDVDLAASSFLPFVNFVATAPTGAEAARFAKGAASIFEAFVTRQQIAQGIPATRRIRLSVVQSGAVAKLVEGHKLSIPILVFVAFLMGTVALALIKENVRRRTAALAHVTSETPSVRSVPAEVETESDPARALPIGKRDAGPADGRDRLMTGSAEW